MEQETLKVFFVQLKKKKKKMKVNNKNKNTFAILMKSSLIFECSFLFIKIN